MSSALALNSMATTASEINSLAIGPTMCTPKISSVLASARIFTMPSVAMMVLARALAVKPSILLLDEPASGLDPRARIELRELLKALQQMGKTILISSHILHELAQLCTRIGIIEAGKMVTQGSVAEIYRELGVLKIVHVQVAHQTPELIASLKGLRGISHVDDQADRISIRFEEGSIEVEDIHDFIHNQGVRIRMFQPEVMDMETAFMKLTEGQTA